MALSWLRLFDALLGVADFALARRAERRIAQDDPGQLEQSGRRAGDLDVRFASIALAALKEVFDRDTRRVEFEREQFEAERRRAERALRLEILRQACDRELGRLRLAAGVAVIGWIGALVLSVRLSGGPPRARIALGVAWALLLGALAAAFAGQSTIGRTLSRLDLDRDASLPPTTAGQLAPWLIVAGLGAAGLAVLVS